MKFEDYRISSEIKQSLTESGLKRPTDIQFKAIPSILKGEDVLAIAQTGTGKTAAFAIPIVHLIDEQKRSSRADRIRAVVMAPTHELALQIAGTFQKFSKYTKVKTTAIFGGTDQAPQIARLLKGVDVLVATPGRLFDLRSQGFIDLGTVEILVLDEADHMLDLGFIKDIEDLIRYLPKKRQTLFFSATIDEKIKKLAYKLVRNAIRIQISPDDPVSKNITHGMAEVEMDDKRFFLERMIKENPDQKMIVFVRTQVRADRVVAAMARVGIEVMSIHGGKDHKERKDAMDRFRSGELKILVATDVSARGIDVPEVDMVINYDIPAEPENYVHRIGRTGRGVRKGKAVSFCSKEEKPLLEEIEKYIGKTIERLEVSKKEYDETILFSEDLSHTWKDIYREIEMADARKPSKKKKK